MAFIATHSLVTFIQSPLTSNLPISVYHHKQKTRLQILDSASQLFTKHGYDKISINQVMQHADKVRKTAVIGKVFMIGSIVLGRAVADSALSEEILILARQAALDTMVGTEVVINETD